MRNFLRATAGLLYVPMMRRLDEEAKFNYLETEDMQMLQMPYIGENLSLVILLPKEHDITPAGEFSHCGKARPMEKGLGAAAHRCLHTQIQDRCQILLDRELDRIWECRPHSRGADFSGISASGGAVHKPSHPSGLCRRERRRNRGGSSHGGHHEKVYLRRVQGCPSSALTILSYS